MIQKITYKFGASLIFRTLQKHWPECSNRAEGHIPECGTKKVRRTFYDECDRFMSLCWNLRHVTSHDVSAVTLDVGVERCVCVCRGLRSELSVQHTHTTRNTEHSHNTRNQHTRHTTCIVMWLSRPVLSSCRCRCSSLLSSFSLLSLFFLSSPEHLLSRLSPSFAFLLSVCVCVFCVCCVCCVCVGVVQVWVWVLAWCVGTCACVRGSGDGWRRTGDGRRERTCVLTDMTFFSSAAERPEYITIIIARVLTCSM